MSAYRSLLLVMTMTMTMTTALAVAPGWAAAGGQQLWVNGYDGPDARDDNPQATAVDPSSGNVYVTGSSVSADRGYDYATVAYTSAGVRLWDARYDGPAGDDDFASGLAVDANTGNVYVTGASGDPTTGFDYATVAYSPAGTPLWVARYNGLASGDDVANALAVDPGTGTVYVTGQTAAVPFGADFATVAYSSTGAQLGIVRYDGPDALYDAPRAIAVNPTTGQIYVAGISTGTATGADYATVAYSRAGQRLWVARYNSPANSAEFLRGLAVDPGTGNVYVTGNSPGDTTNYDYATVAYSATGGQLWVQRFSSDGPGSNDVATAVAVDPGSGSVYVTGQVPGLGGTFDYIDYATLAYSASGATRWERRYNSPLGGADGARALVVHPSSGAVYVTGESVGHGQDFATVGYSSAGSRLWATRYPNPGRRALGAVAIALDTSRGIIHVTGTSAGGSASRQNYTVVAYAAR